MQEIDYGNSTIIEEQPSIDYGKSTLVKDIDPNRKLSSSDLLNDSEWINASKQIYKNQKGKDFIGTDEDIAKWGISNMRDFEWDITKTIGVAADSRNFDQDTAEAWNTSFDKFDKLENFTWEGIGGGLWHTITDPTFVPSMFLGFGAGKIASLAGKRGAKAATWFAVKEAVKAARKKAIKKATLEGIQGKARKVLVENATKKAASRARINTGLVLGTELGAYGGIDNYYRQTMDINLDRRDGRSILETGLYTAGMGGLGYGAGIVLPKLGRLIFGRRAAKENALPDKIFSDQDTITIAKQQSAVDAPISTTTELSKRIAQAALKDDPNANILSYGSGQVDEATGTIREVEELKQSGAKVDAYDLEPNMINKEKTAYKPQYNPYALDNKYTVVNASNVLDNLGSKQNAYNKTRKIVKQLSKSVKDNGTVVINPSKKSGITSKKLKTLLDEHFIKVDWDESGKAWKASNPIEKVVIEIGEDGLPIKKQNKLLMFLTKNFTSDAGAGEIIAQGRRTQKNLLKIVEQEAKTNLIKLEKAIKKEYGSYANVPPKLMDQLVSGVEGRLWKLEGVLPETKQSLLKMREFVDHMQQTLIDNGAVKEGTNLHYRISLSQSEDFAGATFHPPTKAQMKDKGLDNFKFYLNTSYDIFDKPNYKVDPKARATGKQFFIDQFMGSSAKENEAYRLAKAKDADKLSKTELRTINEYEGQDGIIEGLINQITERHGDDYTSQLNNILGATQSNVGKGAIKVLQKKENIDPAIAGLLGETKDVKERFLNTVLKLAKIAGNYEFNKSLRESAKESFLIGPRTPEQSLKSTGLPIVRVGSKGEYSVPVKRLASDPDIEGLEQPLRDLWTTKEFQDIVSQGTELYDPLLKGTWAQIYDSFLVTKALTQLSKTAYSVASTARNLYGAGMSALGNGYITPRHLVEATRAFRSLAFEPPKSARQKIKKMTLLNVLDSDVKVQSMLELSKDIDENFFMKGINKYLPKGMKWFNRKALDTYQSADNYWKWFAFLNEQGRYRNVLRDKGIDPNKVVRTFRSEGDIVEITALDEYAAKMVRENMHNYGETSRAVKYARKSPFTDFISFRTEMFRTSKNIVKNAIKDLHEGVSQMKLRQRNKEDGSLKGMAQFKAGVIRMGGASAAATATGAISVGSIQALGLNKFIPGSPFTEVEAIEYFDPEYNQGSDYIYLSSNGKGEGWRFNLSYIDPWAIFKQPIQSVIRAFQTGDDPYRALDKSTDIIMKNFTEGFGPSIITQALFDIARNQDEFGRAIAKDQGTVKDTASRLIRLWKAFEPGTVTTAKRIYEAHTKGGFTSSGIKRDKTAERWGTIGLRKEKFNVYKSLPLKLIEPTQKLNNSDKYYKKAFKDYRGTDPNVFTDLYQAAQEKKFKEAQEIWKTIQAAKGAGLSTGDIYKSITNGGVFPKHFNKQFVRALIKDGSFIPDKPENTTLRKWQFVIGQTNKEAVKGLPAARKDLWNLYRQYSRLPLTTYEEEVIDYGNDAIID